MDSVDQSGFDVSLTKLARSCRGFADYEKVIAPENPGLDTVDRLDRPARPAQAALPDHRNSPALCPQDSDVPPIPFDIAQELLSPELGTSCGGRRIPAILVAVPEAAVDEYRSPVLREDKVRPARH